MKTKMLGRIKRYKVVTEHGASQTVYAHNMAEVRADFKISMPGVKLKRIMEQ